MGYFGSKATSGLCQPLIAMIPPHDTYIETHLGGGAIMKRKPAALRNIGIDRDARALDAFECDYPVELVHGCAHRYVAEFEFQGSELVYSDPPYLKRNRCTPSSASSCPRRRSSATSPNSITRSPSGSAKPSSASSHNRRCTSTRPRCAWTERITGFTSRCDQARLVEEDWSMR